MHNSDFLMAKFTQKKEYPIWYYKQLEKVDIPYVISHLLKESFVVEINGCKHEITFGKNKKDEIGQCIQYDGIKNSNLCSFEVVEKGFKFGKWFTISNIDTSAEFKKEYKKEIIKNEKVEAQKLYKEILEKLNHCEEE